MRQAEVRGERFGDRSLAAGGGPVDGNDEPVTCIECGTTFMPEPVLKSKQPMPFEVATAQPEKTEAADEDLAAEELVPDEDEEPSADDEVDLSTGDEDLGVATGESDE